MFKTEGELGGPDTTVKRLSLLILPLFTTMNATAYINRYIAEDTRPFARVMVSYGLRSTHIPLGPDMEVPDNDDRNVTVFIQIDTEAMPTDLIADHNCFHGWVCADHPDQPEDHAGCYGGSTACPYPTCAESGSMPEETEPQEHLGAGS